MGLKPRPSRKRCTWRWVTRDAVGYVRMWLRGKPCQVTIRAGKILLWNHDSRSYPFMARDFERLFGFLPPTDRPIKVEFSAKVVDE